MAKKTESIDATIYVKQLVEAGMDEAEAKTKVTNLLNAVDSVVSESDSMETKRSVINIEFRKILAATKSEKYKVTIVAVGPRGDDNSYTRNNAYKIYDEDRETALAQGLVKEVNEKYKDAHKAKNEMFVIALDNRRFLDKAGTIENKFGYGKPLPKRMSRTIIGIVDGVMVRVKGDINVEAGACYEIFGKANDNDMLYAAKEPVPRLVKKLSEAEMYDLVNDSASKSDIAMEAEEVFETDKRGMILVKGIVQSALPTNGGKTRMVLSGGLSVFPNDDATDKIMAESMIGGEVIIAGKPKDPKDPAYKRSLIAFHVVGNPKMGAVGSALDKLKDYEF